MAPSAEETVRASGALQAMEHISNWVRFADTKATILAAGLGVILTGLLTNANEVAKAVNENCHAAFIVGGLASAAALSALWTLAWLVEAITPRTTTNAASFNRFSWPSMALGTVADLKAHVEKVDSDDDAWQQAMRLAVIAERKFAACSKAVWGFALLVVFGVSCVASAVAFTA